MRGVVCEQVPLAMNDTVSAEASAPDDTGIGCLVMLARFFRIVAEPAQLRHQLGITGRPADINDILTAAKSIGFRARQRSVKAEQLARQSLPAIDVMRDGAFLILARANADKVLVQDSRKNTPEELPLADFEEKWNGNLVLLTTRAMLAGDARRFDVTWFIPAIVKYRHLFGEVFVASFFLQIFALVTPLFFQLVIDKVLVHHGLTTLDVLVIGLIAISLFEVVLGALRTYVFSHTTSRVDGEERQLTPGMSVTVEVKTGKRRVIEYVLTPLLRYRDEAIRER